MKNYVNYLMVAGYNPATISQYIKSIKVFKTWAKSREIGLTDINYHEIVNFIDDTMKEMYNANNLTNCINRILLALTNYYDYLNIVNPGIYNPVKNIRIKNPHRGMLHNLLNMSELANLYESIEIKEDRDVRNKVILGLLVFQALTVRELHQLSMADIKLRKGTILVKGEDFGIWRRGSTQRVLDLQALQIIDLIDYINNVRPRILVNAYRNLSGRKPLKVNTVFRTDQFILSLFGSSNIKNSLHHMFINLRKSNSRVVSATQIRQSVIAHWVGKFNLRKVQYMVGHRYVKSTEYYKQINISDLRSEVCKYHPLG